MAQTILVNAYQINSDPLTTPVLFGFPVANCLFRPLTNQLVGTQYMYAGIQFNNTLYMTTLNVTQLAALANA